MNKPTILCLLFLLLCASNFARARKLNHVEAGKATKDFIKQEGIPKLPSGRANKLVALIKKTPATFKMSRDTMSRFRFPFYYRQQYKKLFKKVNKLKAKKASAQEINKARLELNKFKRQYRFFKSYLGKFKKRDWPFCAAGNTYFRYKLRDGCTSHAKMFMALANAKGYFQDMRLIVTKRYKDLQLVYSSLGSGKEPPRTINGHQMVLAKWQNQWYLINTTFYDKSKKRTEILRNFRWGKVSPKAIMHRRLRIPSFQGKGHLLDSLVCVAVGKNRYDDLKARTWADSMKLATRWSAKKLKVKKP